ncbi:hypothetical protein F4782DRAFT_550437 [Xylaria castorea]|nr:hypothetical protein F4782DRAFT_550437 [Xylaria castorea]
MSSTYYNSPKTWGRYGENTQHPKTDDSSNIDKCANWIGGVTKKVAAAFPDSDVESGIMIVRPWHKRPQIWCFTTFVDPIDPSLGGPSPTLHQPIQQGEPNRTPKLGDEEDGNNDSGNQQNANGDNEGNSTTDKTWRINAKGHLIISSTFATLLTTHNLTPFVPTTEAIQLLEHEQSEAVIRFAAEDRQLEALRLALQFALTSTLSGTNELDIVADVVLPEGCPYPTIRILMPKWRHDTKLQFYLAYYILREILRRYRHQPFPDRLDIWEFDFDRNRLLVPYGEDADGETARVRQRIVEELRLEASQQVNDLLYMEKLSAGYGLEMAVELDEQNLTADLAGERTR